MQARRRFSQGSLVGGLLAVLLVSSASLTLGCGDSGTGPEIGSVMPSAASPGETVEIVGERFCGDEAELNTNGTCVEQPEGSVSFGAAGSLRGLTASWSDTRITVTVPTTAPSGATVVVVTVAGVPSNEAAFDVR